MGKLVYDRSFDAGMIGVNSLVMKPYDGYKVKLNEKSELLIKGAV